MGLPVNIAPAIFKSVEPDPVGTLLSTGYQRFSAFNGLKGLAKSAHGRLDILALVNDTSTRGLVRQFITHAKQEFLTICVWEIWNPALHDALLRYGFTPETEVGPDGVPVTGLRWDLPRSIADSGRYCRTCGQKLP